MEHGVRSSHSLDVYDFYKPHHSEYAAVDGKLSQWAYLSSVDQCYLRYAQKHAGRNPGNAPVTVDHFDYFAFHTPYNKLVQKGFSRIIYMDMRRGVGSASASTDLAPYAATPLEQTYESREIEAAARAASQAHWNAKVVPSCRVNQNIGNCYTGSVYSSLLSLVCECGAGLTGKRIMLFSYGSGSVASIFSMVGRQQSSGARFSLERIQSTTKMFDRLAARKRCSIEEFGAALDLRAAKYGKAPMTPDGSLDAISPGTYYLTEVNDKHHRSYARKE
jgi:hydroxymethylglutaryl-CoA synthase